MKHHTLSLIQVFNLLTVFTLSFWGCSPKVQNNNSKPVIVEKHHDYGNRRFIDSTDKYIVKISLDLPQVKSKLNDSIIHQFNNELFQLNDELIDDEFNYHVSSYQESSAGDIVNFYGKEYMALLGKMVQYQYIIDSPLKAYIDIDIKKIFENEKLLTYRVNYEYYLNGVHPIVKIYSIMIDKSTGCRVGSIIDVSKTEKLQSLLSRKICSAFLPEDSIDDQTLMSKIELQTGKSFIPLPNNIYIGSKGIHFLYQANEILSYNDGIIEFDIPYEDIRNDLNTDGMKYLKE